MREDILKDIRTAVDKALSEGKTLHEFQKELKPTLQKKGCGVSKNHLFR